MTTTEAIKILRETNKWRRGEHPYDGDEPKDMPYSPQEFGEAIDALCDEYETLHMNYLSQVGMYKAMVEQSRLTWQDVKHLAIIADSLLGKMEISATGIIAANKNTTRRF